MKDQKIIKNTHNIQNYLQKKDLNLGDYQKIYEDLIRSCYEANSSIRLLDWFSNALISYKKNPNIKQEDLKQLTPLKKDDCETLAKIKMLAKKDNNGLKKLAVIKLNGGLGTSMGCEGPKSLIRVTKTKRFIDFIVDQQHHYNQAYSIDIPLLMMNSFYTDLAMEKEGVDSFLQHRIPRIAEKDLTPLETKTLADWTPPGHGNIYLVLYESGILDDLLDQGKEILFISNSDNLGATIDEALCEYMLEKKLDFLMEVTPRTLVDKKGGSVCYKDGILQLLERVQVKESDIETFEDSNQFQYFNTNNVWVRLRAIKEAIENDQLNLPVMINKKMIQNKSVVQFETAMGAAIKCFKNSACIHVERNRFFPVKKTSDLFLLQSNLVSKQEDGTLQWVNEKSVPSIKLSDEYQTVEGYKNLVRIVPDIIRLTSLTVKGPVVFKNNVKLVGNVSIINASSSPYVLENIEINNQEIMI